jgi:hypothetical protein
MLKSKREFTRFDLPLIVKFRPSYGSTRYSLGLTKNFSFDGLGIEARDFNFIKNENLEMEVKFPQSGSSVSLAGDVVWKRQVGSSNMAGIRLKMKSKEIQKELMGKISANWNIPLDSIVTKGDADSEIGVAKEKKISKPEIKKTKAEARTATHTGISRKNLKNRDADNDKGGAVEKKISKPATKKIDDEARTTTHNGFSKKYLKNGNCMVTFRLPGEAAPDAKKIAIVGDFNDWNQNHIYMTRMKNGDFNATLEIPAGREYRFRYFIDASYWENDWQADKYVPNDFGCDDSVLSL